jgi:hypothetical protein
MTLRMTHLNPGLTMPRLDGAGSAPVRDRYNESMSQDSGLKSAYELAMERLRKADAEAGVERRPVTDAQKAAIAEVRNFYEAKLAELEVLHRGQVRAMADPAERAGAEDNYRRDRERLTSDRDRKIEKIRAGA